MPPKNFVQIGRVVLLTYGRHKNSLAVIVDIVDAKRVLVHGPTTNVPRVCLPLTRIALTRFSVRIPRACNGKTVKKALEDAKIMEAWEKTKWAQKITRNKLRRNMSDFDRFKKGYALCKINSIIRKNLAEQVAAMDKKESK